jgi:hypothetical protein
MQSLEMVRVSDYVENELQDDIRHDWWTVVGFWHESWERWAGHYDCLTPQMAEDLAQMEAKERGLHLAIVAVFEGKLMPADGDYATYVDYEARSSEEMNRKLRALGYLR